MMFSFVTFGIVDAGISKNLDLNLVFPSNNEATEGNDYSWNISQVRKDMRMKRGRVKRLQGFKGLLVLEAC